MIKKVREILALFDLQVVAILLVVVSIIAAGIAYENAPKNLGRIVRQRLIGSLTQDQSKEKNINSKLYEAEDECLKATAKLGNDTINPKEGFKTGSAGYMLLTLEGNGCSTISSLENPEPMDFVIVIDRSGSMSGEKLENVKEAVKKVPSYMNPQDSVSVVIYDDEFETVYSNEADGFNKEKFVSAVDSIESRGGTNIEGGLRQGIEELSEDSGVGKYVILLSDGQANVGESDPVKLSGIVEKILPQEARVTTIGVGADYNERLMFSVAEAGKGKYYFMDSPNEAEEIFATEFSGLKYLDAKNISVKFNPAEAVYISKGVGYTLTDHSKFEPYPIASLDKKEYLFNFAFDYDYDWDDVQKSSSGEVKMADMEIEYTTPQNVIKKLKLPVMMKIDRNGDSHHFSLADSEVYMSYLKYNSAEQYLDVYEYLDKGLNDEAIKALDCTITDYIIAGKVMNKSFDEEIKIAKDKKAFIYDLKDENVNTSYNGRRFQKKNQFDNYDITKNK